MSGSDEEDRQHDPTPRKLEEARRKGDVPRSTDLIAAASYGGILLAGLALGAGSLSGLGATLAGLLARADTLSGQLFARPAPVAGGMLLVLARDLAPWFALPAALALAAVLAQRGFVIAPSKLEPKLSRISPLANARQKFGRNGLFEFAKSFAKLAIYAAVLSSFLWSHLPEITGAVALDPGLATALLLSEVAGLMTLVVAIAAAIGAGDALWQRAEHLRRNRMSRKELVDEQKHSEGDPHLKQARRQRGYDIATNRMLADVPGASVVIVNPTHYAVALKWTPADPHAPVCVAKGVDLVAARIREAAMAAGVPIRRDPDTARALHAAVEIGDEIRPEHYAAVAAAIRFAMEMRQKARGG